MKRAMLLALMLGACAPLRSEPLPDVGPPEYGYVSAIRSLNIRAGETRAERAAWALFSMDPIIITAAVLGVEDEHGTAQLNEYDVTLMSGEMTTVRSRYVVRIGDCILMRRPTGGGYVVVVRQEAAACEAQH